MRYLFVLFLVLSSCAGQRFRLEFPVYLDKMNQIIAVTKEVLETHGIYTEKQMTDAIKNNEVIIYGLDAYELKCKYGVECYGEFLAEFGGRYSISYAANYEDWEAIVGHELIHFFDHIISGDNDFMHKNEKVFESGCRWYYPKESEAFKLCQKESVTNKIRERLKTIRERKPEKRLERKGVE